MSGSIVGPNNVSILEALTGLLGGAQAQRRATQNAQSLRKQGRVAARDVRRDTRRLMSAQRAQFGGDISQGSIVDIMAETEQLGEMAAMRANFGFKSRAAAEKAEGRDTLVASALQGASTILGTELEKLNQDPKPVEGKT